MSITRDVFISKGNVIAFLKGLNSVAFIINFMIQFITRWNERHIGTESKYSNRIAIHRINPGFMNNFVIKEMMIPEKIFLSFELHLIDKFSLLKAFTKRTLTFTNCTRK